MAVLGIDLGATKISAAIFNDGGDVIERRYSLLEGRGGDEAGKLISSLIGDLCKDYDISGAGICVPGIVYSKKGTVWCPNIPGWDDYPLARTLKKSLGDKFPGSFIIAFKNGKKIVTSDAINEWKKNKKQ